MRSRAASISVWGSLLPLLLMTCAHRPTTPPAGMARLILACCWTDASSPYSRLPGAPKPVCKAQLPDARVRLDNVEAGRCLDWSGTGKLVRAGGHRIDVQAISSASERGEMRRYEGDTSAYLILREREMQTKWLGLSLEPYDPPD